MILFFHHSILEGHMIQKRHDTAHRGSLTAQKERERGTWKFSQEQQEDMTPKYEYYNYFYIIALQTHFKCTMIYGTHNSQFMVFLFLSWSVPCSYGSRHHGHTQLPLSECSCWRCSRDWYIPATKVEPNEDTCIQAGKYAGKNPSERHNKDLFFSAVTFLAFFQVAIATALPSVHDSGVWQVEETLPTSRSQVAPQLLQVAVIKHAWKRVTVRKKHKIHVSDVISDIFTWFGSPVSCTL